MKAISTSLICLFVLIGALPAGAEFSNQIGEANAPPAIDIGPFAPDQLGDRDCTCIDLVFVLDSTGSMGAAINNIKLGLASILALADAESCQDLQAGVVAFWDWVDVLQPLTTNMTDVTNALNSVTAAGGAGWPESSDEAMMELATATNCLNLGDFNPGAWRADCCKVSVLVTDATPGGCDDTYVTGIDNANAHQAALDLMGIDVKVGSLYAITDGVPDPITQVIMQDYSVTTGGVYGQIPADGSGTAAAIEQIILECAGSQSDTELCCLDGNCFTVLQGQCDPLGGEVVVNCNDCDSVGNEETSWSTVKSLF